MTMTTKRSAMFKLVLATAAVAASVSTAALAGANPSCDNHDNPNGQWAPGQLFKVACWDGSVDTSTPTGHLPPPPVLQGGVR